MAQTRTYQQTVVARLKRDRAFGQALRAEAAQALRDGELDVGLAMQRDLVHAKETSTRRSGTRKIVMPDFKARIKTIFGDTVLPDSTPILRAMRAERFEAPARPKRRSKKAVR